MIRHWCCGGPNCQPLIPLRNSPGDWDVNGNARAVCPQDSPFIDKGAQSSWPAPIVTLCNAQYFPKRRVGSCASRRSGRARGDAGGEVQEGRVRGSSFKTPPLKDAPQGFCVCQSTQRTAKCPGSGEAASGPTFDTCTPSLLCMPEHSMHSRVPRLREAQSGSAAPQSQQTALPGTLRRMSKGLLGEAALAKSLLLP